MPIPPGLYFHDVEITEEGVFELSDRRRSHFIAKTSIERLSFGHGFMSERAAIMIVLGIVLAAPSLLFAWNAMSGPIVRSTLRVGCALVFVGVTGLVLVREGLRRGVFLRLHTPAGERRVRVAATVERSRARQLLGEARRIYGYEVDERSTDALRG